MLLNGQVATRLGGSNSKCMKIEQLENYRKPIKCFTKDLSLHTLSYYEIQFV